MHTSGPWQAQGHNVHTVSTSEDSRFPDKTECIAMVVDGWDNATGVANARLIAAAPDLLAACELGLQATEVASDWGTTYLEIDGEMMSVYDIIHNLRAAIAKAKGDE